MTSAIVMHGSWEENYDDPSHPVPSLMALDIQGIKTGGGSDLGIVIASPLQADERSQRRLLNKIDIYLRYLKTPEYEKSSGAATPPNTSIFVYIHPESDPLIFELLDRCKAWVQDGGASLQIERRHP